MLAKIGPCWKWKTRLPPVLDEDVRADDVGRHQVGRELDAVEGAGDDVGERADEQRLAQAGHALEQGVAAGEEAGERLADDVRLADDDPADLGLDPAGALDELVGVHGRRPGLVRRGGEGGGLVHHFVSWPVGSRALK